jgi:zinc transport system substrate-binding protein
VKEKSRLSLAFLILYLLGICPGLWSCADRSPGGGRLSVTASIYPLADVVRAVGGSGVEVDVLIPPGASPHVFEPPPEVYRRFSETKLFVMVGAGLEFWAEKLIEANAGKDLRILRAADGVNLIPMAGSDQRRPAPERSAFADDAPGKGAVADPIATAHAEEHQTGNPHVWLDPLLVENLAGRICVALSELDPGRAEEYSRNLSDFRKQLTGLHREIQNAVAGFSIREFVAFHPSWSYFARRYGFREVGIIQRSPGRNPTPHQIEEIVAAIRRYHIRAVFAEPQFNSAAARAIAEEAGVEVLVLDPIGGPGLPGRDSYVELMRHNLKIMQEAMR